MHSITIITYKRPDLLKRLLDSLLLHVPKDAVRIIVVDNDPQGSAQSTVVDHAISATYLIQANPGISHARNLAVEHAIDSEWIFFLDDDEVVTKAWFEEMLAVINEGHADLVAGPVLSKLPETTPEWIKKAGLFDRPRRLTNTRMSEAGSGNLAIKGQVFRLLDSTEWFSPEYGLTGGSDAELTRRLVVRGYIILWSNEAIVWEDVPESRTTLRWLAKRYRRTASVDFRIAGHHGVSGVFRGLLVGLLRIGSGGLTLLLDGLLHQRVSGPGFRRFFRGIGIIEEAWGQRVIEYKR